MLCVRMRREEVSVNLNGMLEVAMVGSLTVSDTISVVVCGQKGTSWESRREGRDGRMEGGRHGNCTRVEYRLLQHARTHTHTHTL